MQTASEHSSRQKPLNDGRVLGILDPVPQMLRNFGAEELRDFLNSGDLVEFDEGATLFREQKDEVDAGWLVVSGSVSLYKYEELLELAHPGDFLGETFVMRPGLHLNTGRTEEPVVLLRFERSRIQEYFRKRPERLFMQFIRNLVESQRIKLEQQYTRMIQNERVNREEKEGES